jgi:hypothetical protein
VEVSARGGDEKRGYLKELVCEQRRKAIASSSEENSISGEDGEDGGNGGRRNLKIGLAGWGSGDHVTWRRKKEGGWEGATDA